VEYKQSHPGGTWPGRLWNAVAPAVLLGAWTAFRRRRQARELQREIDETGRS
jgi:hypothetical protein